MQKGEKVDKGEGKKDNAYVLQIDKYHRKIALYFGIRMETNVLDT